MFKPHYDICRCHNDKRLIVVKAGYCKQGNDEMKQAKKKAEGKSTAKYTYKRKVTGEAAFFSALWHILPHTCEVCLKPLGNEMKPIFFAHIISKGAFPAFRLLDKNIAFMCEKHHIQYDTGDANDPMFDKINERKQLLKEQYNKSDKVEMNSPNP